MLAVLEDAIACFQKYVFARDRLGKALFHETEYWIQDTNNDWTFSFVNVCETLGFDPEYLRQGFAQWKSAKLESRGKTKIRRLMGRNGQMGGARHRLRKVAGRDPS